MKFQEYRINPLIKKALEAKGFKKPTDIQYKAIPNILKGEDVLAIAQTGTGKTAAFAIPTLHMIIGTKYRPGVKVVVMVPTHELALQITEVYQSLAQFTKVKTLALIGGVDQEPQIEALNEGVDVVVATPGRLFDMVSQLHLNLTAVELLVLDEADLMLDLGFYKDITDLINKLPRKRQTLFFSATINEKIKKLAYSIVRNAIRIQISPKDPVSKNITHSLINVEMDDKRFFLERIINEHIESRILVFVRTKVRAERVLKAMARVNIVCETMHSGKNQDERVKTMKGFKDGTFKILIATDVSARGVDIPNVEYVINYDIPDVTENYVHRVGRTGRGDNKGTAVSFCSTEELPLVKDIEKFMGKKISITQVGKSSYKETLDLTDDQAGSLSDLIDEQDESEKSKKKKKRDKWKK
ncbi:MAG: ATP-dependent RNA helicase RhlE [Saprospiraceae bacterium]|jgi:ATP-dependent RNA helicase RhlE